jgi:hypothetical protein
VGKKISAFGVAMCALCVLSFVSLSAYGQDRDRDKNEANQHPNGIVQDWSRRHVVFTRFGSIPSLIAVQNDPRAILSWQEAERGDWHRARNHRHFRDHDHDRDQDDADAAAGVHIDWSISLGLGTTAPAMYPAKFGFDPSATADCTNDFIVYPVNVAGSGTQPNIVGFNQLYSGSAPGPVGICNRTPSGSDTGIAAETRWSYNVHAAGGVVATSPALSLDGAKVAFVETGAGTTAHFHVLAWKSGDGQNPANLKSVITPVTINSFTSLAPTAGSGTASDLTLTPASGTASDTLSSPFVLYNTDTAYIGNDSGTLFRVKDVFCPTTTPIINPACSGGSPPAPSLDTTWGTGGALATGCTGRLTGAVAGGPSGNVYVGCADGKLYGFTSAGVALPGSPLSVGDGTATGGIVDPPLLDVVNGFVYVVSGSIGGSSVLVQATMTNFSSPAPVTATLGAGGSFNLHAPVFNDAYFSNPTSTTWLLYALALNGVGTQAALYGITFNASHVMTSGAPANTDVFGFGTAEFSPATEFLTSGGDRLFESALMSFTGNLASFSLTTFPVGLPPFSATEGSGTTGIVVDNTSGSNQASSIYFGVPSANTAVKLTQGALQ